jgi:hypothetical protein
MIMLFQEKKTKPIMLRLPIIFFIAAFYLNTYSQIIQPQVYLGIFSSAVEEYSIMHGTGSGWEDSITQMSVDADNPNKRARIGFTTSEQLVQITFGTDKNDNSEIVTELRDDWNSFTTHSEAQNNYTEFTAHTSWKYEIHCHYNESGLNEVIDTIDAFNGSIWIRPYAVFSTRAWSNGYISFFSYRNGGQGLAYYAGIYQQSTASNTLCTLLTLPDGSGIFTNVVPAPGYEGGVIKDPISRSVEIYTCDYCINHNCSSPLSEISLPSYGSYGLKIGVYDSFAFVSNNSSLTASHLRRRANPSIWTVSANLLYRPNPFFSISILFRRTCVSYPCRLLH